MNKHGFLQSGSIYIEASLKSSLCSAQDWGATGNMDIRERYLPIFSFEQNRLTRCLQQSWPGVTNNHDSASPITMTRRRQQLWPGAINIYKPDILAMINRQVLQAGWKSDEYFKTNIFVKHWELNQMNYSSQYFSVWSQCQQIDYEGGLLTQTFQKKEMTRTWGWSGGGLQELLTPSTTGQICSCVYFAGSV